MPAKRLSMRKIKEVLRLKWAKGLSNRRIAAACGIGRPTVSEYLRRASEAGLTWRCCPDLDDAHLERLLFPPPPALPADARGIPDWASIRRELKHKSVTLFLLWQEYRQANPDGYQYSWFCEHYRAWRGKLDVVMRQDHRAGEKLFVDYAGQTVLIIDRLTGEIREAQIFVAVLGASNYTYAEATWARACRTGSAPMSAPSGSWGRAGTGGAGQPALRRQQGPPLRARYQSDLPGHGLPLRRGGIAGAGPQTPGQGQGGKRGAGGGALDPGRPAPPPVLLLAGTQCRHR